LLQQRQAVCVHRKTDVAAGNSTNSASARVAAPRAGRAAAACG